MKPTPKKKQPVKARKGVVGPDEYGRPIVQALGLVMGQPVFVLPATQEAYDAMVDAVMAVDLNRHHTERFLRIEMQEDTAKRILAAIGITPPTK